MEDLASERKTLRSSICRLAEAADRLAADAVVDLTWALENQKNTLLRHDNHRIAREALAAEEWRRVYAMVDPGIHTLIAEVEAEANAAGEAVKTNPQAAREAAEGTSDESAKEDLAAAIRAARDEVFSRRSVEYNSAQSVLAEARITANEAQSAVLALFADGSLKEQVDLAYELVSYARSRLDRLTSPGVSILQFLRV